MSEILNIYRNSVNNATPEEQILILKGEIHDCYQFIKMYEDDIKNSQDIIEAQKAIDFCNKDIIRMNNMIESIRKGEVKLVINFANVDTNM